MATEEPPTKKMKAEEGSASPATLNELKELLVGVGHNLEELCKDVNKLKGTASEEADEQQNASKQPDEDDDDSDGEKKKSKSVKWIHVMAHCKDACDVVAYDENDKQLAHKDGYPPSFISEHGAVSLKIDVETGKLLHWSKPTPVEILSDLIE